jgi:hypothetical protein
MSYLPGMGVVGGAYEPAPSIAYWQLLTEVQGGGLRRHWPEISQMAQYLELASGRSGPEDEAAR